MQSHACRHNYNPEPALNTATITKNPSGTPTNPRRNLPTRLEQSSYRHRIPASPTTWQRVRCSKIELTAEPTPVFFMSHGSTMMLGEESAPADFWLSVGQEATRRGVKGVVMMGAHWECLGDKIQVAMKPNPGKSPVAYVDPKWFLDYKINASTELGAKCISLLKKDGFKVEVNDEFDYIHDTFLVLIRMFP